MRTTSLALNDVFPENPLDNKHYETSAAAAVHSAVKLLNPDSKVVSNAASVVDHDEEQRDFTKKFEIPKHFQDCLSECSRRIEESHMNWNFDFQNMEDDDQTPRQSLNYDNLIGKGLLESPHEVKFVSLQSQNQLGQFSSLRIRNKRKTMMGLTRDGDFIPQQSSSNDSDVLGTMQVGSRFKTNTKEVSSPSIMRGGADVLLSYENTNTQRDLHFLSKRESADCF